MNKTLFKITRRSELPLSNTHCFTMKKPFMRIVTKCKILWHEIIFNKSLLPQFFFLGGQFSYFDNQKMQIKTLKLFLKWPCLWALLSFWNSFPSLNEKKSFKPYLLSMYVICCHMLISPLAHLHNGKNFFSSPWVLFLWQIF